MIDGAVSVAWLHPGHWSNCFGQSLLDLVMFDASTNGRIVCHRHGTIPKESGSGQIVASRNTVTSVFLDGEAEWLLFIDSDMGFAADTAERLIAAADPAERPIVGALAFAAKSDGSGPFFARRYRATPTVYRFYEDDSEIGFVPLFDYPADAVLEVDATGAACILIHRGALEAIGERWWDHIEVPKGPAGRTTFSEDLSFCLRARAAGLPVHVHTGVKTTHDKGGVFLDEDTFVLQQALLAFRGVP